jgi:glycosyltransferase involved in cell wall biosynthesis
MSVYNGQPYVEESVDSILSQTLEDFEFIIINDGSTDGSRAVLEQFAERDNRVRLIHQTNRGLTPSLNRGLELARGTYIARMDDDDISHPDRLGRQVCFLEANPDVGVLGGGARVIDETGEPVDYWVPPTKHGHITWRLLFNACFTHPSVMVRRSLLQDLGGYADWARCSQDHELWTRAVQETRLAALPDELIQFRRSEGSITATSRDAQMKTNCRAAAQLHRALLGSAADYDIAHFLVWLHQFDLDTATEETGVEDFRSVFEYLRVLYKAHVERFCEDGSRIQVRREVLPRLDRMAEEVAKRQGWGAGVWHKARARLMPPTQDAIPWMWRAARDRLSSTSGSDL